ncbi:hypothetical protein B0H11DRAFT_2432352, partial [Mycena galericulata]
LIYPRREAIIVRWGREEKQNATEIFTKTERYLASQAEKKKRSPPGDTENQKSSDEDLDENVVIPKCSYCKEHVSRPCWFCVECSYDIFICDRCEEKQLKMSKSVTKSESEGADVQDLGHKWHNVLVRVKDIVPEPPRVELDKRLTMLEDKFAAHESVMRQKLDSLAYTIAEIGEKVETLGMDDRLSNLEGRLSNLEGLLTKILAKLD